MSIVFRFIHSLIRFALVLGATGGLVDVATAMLNEAAQAHQHGLVSLRRINAALLGESTGRVGR